MKILRVSQAGDTIVEVLIAIGIISLVLTAAYVTANRSYRTMLDAQERGNALKLLERQVEALKTYTSAQLKASTSPSSSGPFCIQLSGGTPQIYANSGAIPTNPCILNPDATKATDPSQEPAYNISIAPTVPTVNIGAGTDYTLTVTWDSYVDRGKSKVQLEYGVY